MANFNGFEASSLIDQGLDDIEAIGQMTCIRPSEESPYVEIPDTGIVPGIVGKAIGEIESKTNGDGHTSAPTPHNTIKGNADKVKKSGETIPDKAEEPQPVQQQDRSKVKESNITMNPDSSGFKQLFNRDTELKTNSWKNTIAGSMMNHKDENKLGIRGGLLAKGEDPAEVIEGKSVPLPLTGYLRSGNFAIPCVPVLPPISSPKSASAESVRDTAQDARNRAVSECLSEQVGEISMAVSDLGVIVRKVIMGNSERDENLTALMMKMQKQLAIQEGKLETLQSTVGKIYAKVDLIKDHVSKYMILTREGGKDSQEHEPRRLIQSYTGPGKPEAVINEHGQIRLKGTTRSGTSWNTTPHDLVDPTRLTMSRDESNATRFIPKLDDASRATLLSLLTMSGLDNDTQSTLEGIIMSATRVDQLIEVHEILLEP
ncbi:phosphoprotein P [Fer-de-lance virus]|uniref:Phosphoprotein P n=1 Tax=Fer-de-lance virus TaxID=2907837 RepID=Q6YIS4_9MONO|nr:phosphoprotein P [Fer-de-lance virus]AAN18262.1 phosphoprotein P [Fer-de-lance virus]